MREIKFRAWNKEKKVLVYDNEDDTEDYWDGAVASNVGMVNGRLSNNDYLWMQYTGLKDKNGKDIYEGDIVSIDGLIVPVIWYAGAWMVEYFTIPTKSYLSHFDELDVEIIGNKYENPELLK